MTRLKEKHEKMINTNREILHNTNTEILITVMSVFL